VNNGNSHTLECGKKADQYEGMESNLKRRVGIPSEKKNRLKWGAREKKEYGRG